MLFSEVFVDNWLLEVFGESVPLEKVNIPNERTSVSVGSRFVNYPGVERQDEKRLCVLWCFLCWACGIERKKAASGDVSAPISNIIIVIDVLLLEMFL